MKLQNVFWIIAVFMMLLAGCGGGDDDGTNNLSVGAISGPLTIAENGTGTYSVTASGDTGITYIWTCDPGAAGTFSTPTAASTGFTASPVSSDLSVTIRVSVSSDNDGPILANLAIVVEDTPTSGDGWAVTWGSTSDDRGNSVATDGYGNVYVAGSFADSTDFDRSATADVHTSMGGTDAFLTCYDSSGTFRWAQTWGGTGDDTAMAVAVADSGEVYVAGQYEGTVDLDPTSGTQEFTSLGDTDAFFTRFDSDGNCYTALTWGGTGEDTVQDVSVDSSGNIGITGGFTGTVDFNPGSGVSEATSLGEKDVYVLRLDQTRAFDWIRTWGGTGRDYGTGITHDASGNVFVCGVFSETVNFNPAGSDTFTSGGDLDSFVTILEFNGLYVKTMTWGSAGTDRSGDIALDASTNIFVCGDIYGEVDFDPGTGVAMSDFAYHSDPYINALDSGGNHLWFAQWDGNLTDMGNGIACDTSGNVYVTGYFHNGMTGPFDDYYLYIRQYSGAGVLGWENLWEASPTFKGRGQAITVDEDDFIYATGLFHGTADFDPGTGVDTRISEGEWDAFLLRFDNSGAM